MPDIKKVLLKKQISNVMYSIYPKTDATIVDYTKTVDENDVTTTVAAELLSHAGLIADRDTSTVVNTKITNAIDSLRKEILGLGDNETKDSIAAAYDTIKEIATFIAEHEDDGVGVASYFNRIAALEAKLGHDAVAAVGEPGDADYVAPQIATGIVADTRDLQTRVTALEAVGSTKVEDGDENGFIKVDNVNVEVYDDSDLRTRLGYASAAAVGTEGQDGYVPAKAATGLFLRVETLEDDLDALEDYVGTASSTVNEVVTPATGLTARIEAIETNAVYSVTKHATEDGVIQVTTGNALHSVTTNVTAYTGDPTVVDQDANHRFVTDAQITSWTNLLSFVSNLPATPDESALYLLEIV